MSDEPLKIELERVLAGLGCMGIEDTNNVRRVVVEPHAVTVERYRLNEKGFQYLDPQTREVALETVVMPIDFPTKPPVDTEETKP